MRQFIKRIVKTILVGYVLKFIRNKLSGKSSHSTNNNIIKNTAPLLYDFRVALYFYFAFSAIF